MARIKKIIHIDMDASHASVEQRDNSQYKGKPLAVGASPIQRGVVAAASYEARKFGIHSAMPSKLAVAKCPNLIFVKPRFEVYRAVSIQIHDVFKRYTDIVEPVALDEAYLDVTENKLGLPYACTVARHIRQEILQIELSDKSIRLLGISKGTGCKVFLINTEQASIKLILETFIGGKSGA